MKVGVSRFKQCLNQKIKNLSIKFTISFVKTCNLQMLCFTFGMEIGLNTTRKHDLIDCIILNAFLIAYVIYDYTKLHDFLVQMTRLFMPIVTNMALIANAINNQGL